MTRRVDLAVVGAGISGLAAAWEAYQRGAEVVVLDAAATAGGKLRTSRVAGLAVDESADAFLVRRPEALELCHELGIGQELVSPQGGSAYLWVPAAEELRRIPAEQLLGVPTDLASPELGAILSPAGLARAQEDLDRPGSASSAGHRDGPGTAVPDGRGRGDGDRSVGELVRERVGAEVHDLLVAPLIGGIWAGDTDRLSVQVTAPAIAEAAAQDASLIRGALALREAAASAGTADRPVFLAPRGGMARLVQALSDRLGDRVLLDGAVTGLVRYGDVWQLEPFGIRADKVVVAVPAGPAAALVAPSSARAATGLAAVDHASVTLVTLAVARDRVDHALDGSGYLVPPGSGLLLTACSWASSKWAQLSGDGSTVILRASAGRAGDTRASALGDGELLERLLADLRLTMGLHGAPEEVRVTRWPDGFPQPRPGHLARVEAIDDALAEDAPGLASAGAWSRGVGIPACIGSGRSAAARLLF